jgi:acetyl-CoA carboxylase carboxyl transferase subunit alpha
MLSNGFPPAPLGGHAVARQASGNGQFLSFEKPILDIERKIREFEELSRTNNMDFSEEIEGLKRRRDTIIREIFSGLSPWQRVELARHPKRPQTLDYVERVFSGFVELAGDRTFGNDRAIVTGLANLGPRRLVVVGQQKGRTTKEAIACNWGCPLPEGYRKALRKMRLAERFRLPVVTFIDTKGAHPGIGAEERGQALAIAENLEAMAHLRTPVVCVVIGEGGSGGALGIGVGDRTAMLEFAYYSVISPEGCAAILWKTEAAREEAAAALKLTPRELLGLGVVDEVIPEPLGGAHRDPDEMSRILAEWLARTLDELSGVPLDELLRRRYAALRRRGAVREGRELPPSPEPPAEKEARAAGPSG